MFLNTRLDTKFLGYKIGQNTKFLGYKICVGYKLFRLQDMYRIQIIWVTRYVQDTNYLGYKIERDEKNIVKIVILSVF